MKQKLLIVTALLLLMFSVVGCWEEVVAGIGIGAATEATFSDWEKNLEMKGIELAAEYDQQILKLRNTVDANDLKFEEAKAKTILVAITANDALKITAKQVREKESRPTTVPGWINLLIPIALTAYTRERLLRGAIGKKRQAEKAGRELALKELHEMSDEDITSAKVERIMYEDIGKALKG